MLLVGDCRGGLTPPGRIKPSLVGSASASAAVTAGGGSSGTAGPARALLREGGGRGGQCAGQGQGEPKEKQGFQGPHGVLLVSWAVRGGKRDGEVRSRRQTGLIEAWTRCAASSLGIAMRAQIESQQKVNMRLDYDTRRAGRKIFLEGRNGEYRGMGGCAGAHGREVSDVGWSGPLARQGRARVFARIWRYRIFARVQVRILRGKSRPIGGIAAPGPVDARRGRKWTRAIRLQEARFSTSATEARPFLHRSRLVSIGISEKY